MTYLLVALSIDTGLPVEHLAALEPRMLSTYCQVLTDRQEAMDNGG